MKPLFLSLTLVALILNAHQANAADYVAYAGSWNQHYKGDLIDEDGRKDVKSQLAIKNSSSLEAGVTWFGQDGWIPNVRLGVFQIKGSGRNTLSEPSVLDLLDIAIDTSTGSADVRTEIDYLTWSSNFFYGFRWKGVVFEVGGALNLVDGTVEADVDYDAVAEAAGRTDERRKNTTLSIIPTGYGAASRQLNDWLSLSINFYGASTGKDGVGQYSLALEAAPDKRITVVAGYRAQVVDFFDEDKQTGLDVNIAGLFGGVAYQF